jgi:uncharacterized membrane protein
MPTGSVPVSLNVGVGNPEAVTWNEPTVPTLNVSFAALVMARACPIVNVKSWLALDPMPLWALMVMEYVPPVFAVGVPLSVPPGARVTPAGSVPVSLKLGAGNPVAVTGNELLLPTVNVVAAALVTAGAWSIVNVKLWVAFAPTPLLAVMAMGYEPPVFAAAVPPSTPAGERVTPAGSAPLSLNVGAGNPDPVTVNEPGMATVKVVAAALVTAGAWFIVSVKGWVPFDPTPLLAMMVMG